MATKSHDLTNRRFHRLVATSRAGKRRGYILWNCSCDCGGFTQAQSNNLLSGRHKSCGSTQDRSVSSLRHGHASHSGRTSEYLAWQGMRARCCNPRNRRFPDWGGRGIKVCDRWIHSFENFLADMGPKPSSKHSLDRIDNDGDYTFLNCRWATQSQQSKNRRKGKLLSNFSTAELFAELTQRGKQNGS